MSTTIPESVTTQTTSTATTTSTVPTTSTTVSSHEPADALAPLSGANEPTLAEKAKVAALSAGTTISAAAQSAGAAISAAASQAGTAISNAAHDFDSRHHVSDKASDMAAHVGAALKHGNPVHAAKHASTAATIGDAERAKHEAGPLADGAHVANTVGTATSSTTTTTSSSGPSISDQASAAATKIGNQASDAASFAGAAISAGNPIHAAKYASTAATIGEVEREKHAHGLLDNEAEIAKVTHH